MPLKNGNWDAGESQGLLVEFGGLLKRSGRDSQVYVRDSSNPGHLVIYVQIVTALSII